MTSDEALRLLAALGASPWLVRHHELVVEAARALLAAIPAGLLDGVDRELVLMGCALHDAGKVLHPAEQHEPGHLHEEAGRRLLTDRGLPDTIARFSVTHAIWSERSTSEDLLVALADKLWKGKREASLEELVLLRFADQAGVPVGELYPTLDDAFERVAAAADDRLERSSLV